MPEFMLSGLQYGVRAHIYVLTVCLTGISMATQPHWRGEESENVNV